ncbi:twin-arginine translocase subunit TatC [Pseudoteredinibacter isoporae]|uniref:Sec-independent protein translocase protein TatC n=1 Tax=Pseudoteredinibacter isoporae TaxID=570281 RepID=A0A7X0JPI0_9GAMM|nr:twin-arginine translocase subunit TatC [Pseudoteredinibacter isoporae]MBB6519847.1 sec-independent protein translocase protein TatC [Pseudoteredinibacter isoporae]NHO85426.1 twin-arginine translocase subunit TatC [Pseudoteredinibacter isoporae]NIB26122.1 twin-arginine translocase subunit TatC [Pseudoteredinibacter isoporae]
MSEPNEHQDVEQPLVQHLIELRDRLLRCILIVLLVFAGLFYFANDIYTFVAAPLQKFLPEGAGMIATEVAAPFLTPFKLTLFVSIFVSMPFLIYQVWQFIAPAMYKEERRLALPIFASSVVLFYAGIAFAYYVVFPLVFGFFTSVAPEGVSVMTDMGSYLDFILKLFFAFGLAFEIPIATFILISAGVSTPESLAEKRPYIIVGCFILGMLLTPPDVISQLLLALPMWLLFEVGIIMGKTLVRPQTET